jgi:DNA-directed RNA polymerase subunit RPC12/RpoP
MKAITCSQCGASIKKFDTNAKYVECEYCHSNIPVLKEKVFVIPNPKPVIKKVGVEQKVSALTSYDIDPPKKTFNPFIPLIVMILIIGGIAILFGVILKDNKSRLPKTSADQAGIKTDTEPSSTNVPANIPTFSYKTSVSYNSLIGAEYIETPTIEPAQVNNLTNEDLKKDVFKEKRIRVEIKINQAGEVTDAKALNGHEILKESAVRAAKNSLFTNRNSPSTATLTYIFLLVDNPK